MAAQPVVVIVGQTASGKTDLAIDIAKNNNGAIIAADSRTVYKSMDIGTAKPTKHQQSIVPHYLIDVADPNQRFTVAQFKKMANQAINDVQSRGKLPIMVGGTGLYIDAVLYDFKFRTPENPKLRSELQVLSVNELQAKIIATGLIMPSNHQNPRHLMRTLETNGEIGQRSNLRANTLVIGLAVPIEQIKQQIIGRVDKMISQSLETEAKNVASKYGWDAPALDAIGYREFRPSTGIHQDIEQIKQQIIRDSNAYAKRQRTWFRRNSDIVWCDSAEQAKTTINQWLNKN
jgi:tRNA dimethylallyltransferase